MADGSFLTPRAIEGRPPALDDPPNPGAASASPALAVIDPKACGEIAELAVGPRIIAKSRSAGLDRLGNDFPDRCDEAPHAGPRQPAGCPARVDPGAVKRFAHIDIAKAGDDPLVEQQRLYRRGSAAKLFAEPARIEVRRLGPKRSDRRPGAQRLRRDQVHRAETPRVVERQPPPLVGLDQQMVVGIHLRRVDSPLSRHSEMENQRVAAVGPDQPELSPAAEPGHPCPCQPLAKVVREGPAEVGSARLDPHHSAAEQHPFEASDSGFDFGELWHRRDMANVAAAS